MEQPFVAADRDSYLAYRQLPQRLPVLIDEGCTELRSVAPIASYADDCVPRTLKEVPV